MLGSVNLHHQFGLGRVKIINGVSDWSLPIKLNAFSLLAPQSGPESLFAVRHISAQGSGNLF
jgi:hypothetical protein